jgi:hypothetical protein
VRRTASNETNAVERKNNRGPGGFSDFHTGAPARLAGEQSEAAARNSTQAAKKLYPGEVSVNLQRPVVPKPWRWKG